MKRRPACSSCQDGGRVLTCAAGAGQLLLPQQKPISIRSLRQGHGLGHIREASAFRQHGQDGHLPLDEAGFSVSVDDQHRHRVFAPLRLPKRGGERSQSERPSAEHTGGGNYQSAEDGVGQR